MENMNAKTILNAGAASAGAFVINNGEAIPYIVIPDGYKVQDVEKMLPIPFRKRAQVTLDDEASFIDYAKRQGSLDSCVIYARADQAKNYLGFMAVINDHGEDIANANWRDHTAEFEPEISIELSRWTGADRKRMRQADFASFIEDNIADIATVSGMPTGTEMLGMAVQFDLTSEKRFKKVIDLQTSGVALEFVDKADENCATRLSLFRRFTVGVPVFRGESGAYPIEARMKFKQSGDCVEFWYELVRPDRVFQAAADELVGRVRAGTGFPVLMGSPFPAATK